MKKIFDPKYPITKMHGTGNDFVLYVDFEERTTPDDVRKICDRHFGVGADGVITVAKSRVKDARYRMKYFNSDGSFSEMCGNGIRCFAKYLVDNKLSVRGKIPVDTDAGIIIPEVIKNNGNEAVVRVDMGKPVFVNPKHTAVSPDKNGIVRIEVDVTNSDKKAEKLSGIYVSMGNPHAVFFVKKGTAGRYAREYGSQIELNTKIFPQKTNVEFVEINNRGDLNIHIWERGVGITLSCGTGACATFAASVLDNITGNSAKVHVPGGTLELEWEGRASSVFMAGPAVNVFKLTDLNI